uniref:Uncharacterized protein n=1 Tax=Anguilla anguilla TaxID=7936 RepID=A0A0E9RI37_ANGAN
MDSLLQMLALKPLKVPLFIVSRLFMCPTAYATVLLPVHAHLSCYIKRISLT